MRAASLVSIGVLAFSFAVDRVTAQNLFEIYPTRPNISTTDYTRLGVPTTGGDILVEVAPTHFCNVGGSAFCACSASEIDVTLMDMNNSTPNSFRGVIQSPIGTYLAVTAWTAMTVGTGGAFGRDVPRALSGFAVPPVHGHLLLRCRSRWADLRRRDLRRGGSLRRFAERLRR